MIQTELPLTPRTENEVEAAFTAGNVYLIVDAPKRFGYFAPGFVDARSVGHNDELRLVHVISRSAGGEIRSYVLDESNVLHLGRPAYTSDWPEMDAAVAQRVSATRVVVAEVQR